MTDLSDTLMSKLKRMTEAPTMYESTPESAHGMFFAFAIVVLHEALQVPFREAHREAIKILRIVNKDIPGSDVGATMLCHEQSEKLVTSYTSFRTRSQKFLELLEARISDVKK